MKHNKIKLPIRWLLFAVLITALVSSVTLSRYVTTVSGTGTAQVAKWDVQLTAQNSSLTFNGSDYGDSSEVLEYKFDVTSNSEVALEYGVTVSFTEAPPEQVSLWIDEQGESAKMRGDGKTTEFNFNNRFTRALDDEKTKTHTLYVQVDYVDKNGEPYTFENINLNDITLTVTAQQTN